MVNCPCGVMRPIAFEPGAVIQRLPSAPSAMASISLGEGSANSVMVPLVVIFPALSASNSENQSALCGPDTIDSGHDPKVGVWKNFRVGGATPIRSELVAHNC